MPQPYRTSRDLSPSQAPGAREPAWAPELGNAALAAPAQGQGWSPFPKHTLLAAILSAVSPLCPMPGFLQLLLSLLMSMLLAETFKYTEKTNESSRHLKFHDHVCPQFGGHPSILCLHPRHRMREPGARSTHFVGFHLVLQLSMLQLKNKQQN